ncbi:MAG: Sporulation protein YpeB [Firmicutes bacterium ADurb.Bin373]|nr:germination protein YpeB [Bacillota bacterium]OQA11194.1 MAG: Sporulation protein YpeB [Firmicutes bacterium ADurb.Bin373]
MRRWIIPVVIGLLALAAAGSWGYNQRLANRNLENFLNNKYQRAFFDMTAQVQNIEVLLSKSMVAADPRLDSTLLMDIRQQAAFAQSNLGQLPLNDALSGRTAKFLTQVGDYADSLSKQVGKGGSIDAKHWEALNSLYQQSMELNQELQGMQYKVAQNNFYFGELVRQVRKNLQNNPDNLAQSDFQVLDQRMQRYPALIYDGPFSEHLERTEPRDLSGLAEVGPGEAQHKALSFIDGKQGVDYQAAVTGSAEGRIPAYRVEVSPAGGSDSEKYVMDISKKGGKLVWMINSRPVGNQSIDINAARQKALDFLKNSGFGDMKATYFQRHENSATFNFAALQNGVVLYPDLIKVTVALDNGEITGAETSGYLMSHRRRDLPAAGISREQAMAELNQRLQARGGNLVLIPLGSEEEKLAYEFQGRLGEDNYLIYVNALDGREENVLKLIESPDGTLTM